MYAEGRNPGSTGGAWSRVVSAPHVRALAAASVVARLPFGMGGVALVIFVHARTGSFGVAGVAAGAFTLSFALAGPLLGRLVDRRGSRPVLLPASCVCALGTLGVVAVGEGGAATVPLVLTAALAGGATPPISGVLRRAWPSVVAPDVLETAYIFDSVLVEIFFFCGPLLTGLLAAAVDPAAPLIAAAALVLLGTVWFLLVPVFDAEETAAPHRGRAGGLSSPSIRFITFLGVPLGASFGALDIALPAFGAAHGSSALGGPFAAALAAGSMLGAALFSFAGKRLGNMRQAMLRMAVAQPFLIAPLLLAPAPVAIVVLALPAGSFAAPIVTLRSQAAQIAMQPGTETETFTWLLLAVMVTAGAASAVAGPLVEGYGWRAGVLLAIAVPLLSIPAIYLGRGLFPSGPAVAVERLPGDA